MAAAAAAAAAAGLRPPALWTATGTSALCCAPARALKSTLRRAPCPSLRWRRQRATTAAAQQNAGGGGGGGFGRRTPSVQQARKLQLEASEVLAELMKAANSATAAAARSDDLTPEFFTVASAYLDMAKKEGNPEIVAKIESCIGAALAEKERTLRPEIRLLNALMRTGGKPAAAREAILEEHRELVEDTSSGYFYTLVGRVRSDLKAQPRSDARDANLALLDDVDREARALATQRPASS